jgi:predicted nucleotidyltransferase component of viral defense system
MKIEIEINEDKIKELAQEESLDNLPRAIWYQAKKEAIDSAVNEIKSKTITKPYYDSNEYLIEEIRERLFESLEKSIQKFVEGKLKDKELESIIDRRIEVYIDQKLLEKLEKFSNGLMLVNTNDQDYEEQQW